jgi:hypothetical protein
VSYGVPAVDRQTMLSLIQSASKRRLARVAKRSTRSIPIDESAASKVLVKELRHLFDVASSLLDEDRERQERPSFASLTGARTVAASGKGVFQHRVMGGSSSAEAATIGQDVEDETRYGLFRGPRYLDGRDRSIPRQHAL